MRVLSIDIDFFVTPVAHGISFSTTRRLSENRYKTVPDSELLQYLARFGLSADSPAVPGVFIRDHVGAYDVIADLVGQHGTPIDELVHVDAHADLGMGDSGYCYLLLDVAHRPLARRRRPRRRRMSGLNSGNWLPFVVANQWVRSVRFVPPSNSPGDIVATYFREYPPLSNSSIEIIAAQEADLGVVAYQGTCALERAAVFRARPVVASAEFTICDHQSVSFARPDYVIICQSPQYTPSSADRIFELSEPFVVRQSLPRRVRAPI